MSKPSTLAFSEVCSAEHQLSRIRVDRGLGSGGAGLRMDGRFPGQSKLGKWGLNRSFCHRTSQGICYFPSDFPRESHNRLYSHYLFLYRPLVASLFPNTFWEIESFLNEY